MRHLQLISVTVILLIGSQKIQSRENTDLSDDFQPGKVIISGTVNNFEKYPDHVTVRVTFYEFGSGGVAGHSSFIDERGYYKIEFIKIHPQDVLLIYANRYLTIFIEPGDSQVINIDANNIRAGQKDSEFVKSFSYAGDGAELNRMISNYVPLKYEMVASKYQGDPDWFAQTLSIEEYEDYCYQRREAQLGVLAEYRSNNTVDEAFLKWAQHEIDYECAEMLQSYYLEQRKVQTRRGEEADYEAPESYYGFYDTFPLDNKDASISEAFHLYLSDYAGRLGAAVRDKYGISDVDLLREEYFKQVINSSEGYLRDVLLSQFLYGLLITDKVDEFEQYYEQCEILIGTPAFKEFILSTYDEIYNKETEVILSSNTVIETLLQAEHADPIITDIFSRYKGRVIYIDFWATWCGPCLVEMPVSKRIQESFQDRDVAFIYFCAKSPENVWKTKISELGLGGYHYLLNDRQYEILSAHFGTAGFPHHVLIDKEGIINDNPAPRPSIDLGRTVNQGLVSKINTLLAQ